MSRQTQEELDYMLEKAKMPKLPEERTESEFLERMNVRGKLLKQRYSITEKQLQGLIKHEHRKTRECLAIAVRKQDTQTAQDIYKIEKVKTEDKDIDRICEHCNMPIRIRNPSGFCDHLQYPEYCDICKRRQREGV